MGLKKDLLELINLGGIFMKKKLIALTMTLAMAMSITACGAGGSKSAGDDNQSSAAAKGDYVIGMVTDTGGVNDKSFNQSAWEGLQELKANTGADVTYLESTQESDYATNLDKEVDEGKNLIWGVGFAMADAVKEAAEMNDDINFGIIDNVYDEIPENVTCLSFSGQDPSFLVGYAAGLTTKTDSVGFVGGISSDIIDQFEFGYRAGVEYAAKELGKEIKVDVQYADSFTDSAKGKAIATTMFSNGADIVFHAAGGVGTGVIEAAVEANKFAIGVDSDQLSLAPKNVLTSALKRVDVAVCDVSQKLMDGEDIGGQTYNYDLTNGGVGIPEENPNMDKEVYKKTIELQDKVAAGEITVPYNEATYKEFNK